MKNIFNNINTGILMIYHLFRCYASKQEHIKTKAVTDVELSESVEKSLLINTSFYVTPERNIDSSEIISAISRALYREAYR